jgi:hypothetical protein
MLRLMMEQYKHIIGQNRAVPEVLADLNSGLERRNRSELMTVLKDSSIYLQNGTVEYVHSPAAAASPFFCICERRLNAARLRLRQTAGHGNSASLGVWRL